MAHFRIATHLDTLPGFVPQAALWIAAEDRLFQAKPRRCRYWATLAAEGFRALQDHVHLTKALRLAASKTPEGPTRLNLLDQALEAAKASGDESEIALIQSTRGQSLLRAGELRQGIEALVTSSARIESLGLNAEAGSAWLALARGYFLHGRDKEARIALHHGEALLGKAGNSIAAMTALQEAGSLLAASGNPQKAATFLETAQRYAESPQAPIELRLRLAGVAFGYLSLGDQTRAAAITQKLINDFPRRAPLASYWILSAASFRLKRFDDSAKAAQQGLKRANDPQAITTLLAHYWRGRALDRLGRPGEAATHILAAMAAEDIVRSKLMAGDEGKRAFGDMLEPMAGVAIEILFRARRYADALSIAERSRARAFLDLLAGRQSAPIPSNAPATAEHLMQTASKLRQPLAAYWVCPDAVYIWLINAQGKLQATRSLVSELQLQSWIRRARTFSYKPDRAAWRQLHRILIQPIAKWLPPGDGTQLTLLPHGQLLQIPFAALISESGKYLAEEYLLRYIPAGVLLNAPRKQANPGHALLIGAPSGPPAGQAGKPLAYLPGARLELASIAAQWPAHRSRLLTGPSASAETFRIAAPNARAIHFATHAVVDAANPFDAFLALSHRSKLTATDIYGLHLDADLVVLSACRSASGKVSADGLLGLTRAFLFAGASSVIAPLWDIADEPTVRFISIFYKNYHAGMSKSRALRTAQLALLEDLRLGKVNIETPAGPLILPEHPMLWAGFILQGSE